MDKYKQSPKKIVTIGINPSLKEFEEPRFNIVDLQSTNAIQNITQTLNAYFRVNPYKWFNDFDNIRPSLSTTFPTDLTIEKWIFSFKGYACNDWKKQHLVAVLDILRAENKPMTVDEVKQKCFNNRHKYGIEENEKNKKIIYECLYQHADCNKNKNADMQSKLFIRDNLKRYTFDPKLKLW